MLKQVNRVWQLYYFRPNT